MLKKMPILFSLLTLALCIILAGCSQAPEGEKLSRSEVGGVYQATAPARKAEGMAESELSMDSSANRAEAPSASSNSPMPSKSAVVQAASFQPQIIKTARLTLQVEKIETSMKSLEKLTTHHRGMITNQSLYLANEGGNYRSGSLEVRVPQAALDIYLDDLSKSGKIIEQQVTGQDVGAEIVDTESRIKNLKAQEAALQSIMHRAGKIPDVLQVAQELSNVRGQIEENQGRVNHLRQQVAYSTVTITLREKNLSSSVSDEPSLFSVLGNTFNMAFSALYGAVLWLLEMLVWVVIFFVPFLAIVGLTCWGLWKLIWRFILKPACCKLNDCCGGLFKSKKPPNN